MDETFDGLVRQVRRRIELEQGFGITFEPGGPASAEGEARMPQTGDRAEQLAALEQEMSGCQACPLGATRTNLVFGTGDAAAA